MTPAASIMPTTVTRLPPGGQLPTTTPTTPTTGPNTTLTQTDFLTLLTTQLEHQDPLNPQNPSEFAAELAQFSTASGVQTLNTTMTSVGELQAAGLVGQNVAVPGNQVLLGANGTAQGAFNLTGPASDVTVTVLDSSGSPIRTLDLGAMSTGNQSFTWDGKDTGGNAQPPGAYTYTLTATPAAGGTTRATPFSVAPVLSVVLNAQTGPILNLAGGLASVPLSAVQEVL